MGEGGGGEEKRRKAGAAQKIYIEKHLRAGFIASGEEEVRKKRKKKPYQWIRKRTSPKNPGRKAKQWEAMRWA